MRISAASRALTFLVTGLVAGSSAPSFAQSAPACTGLCLQQVSCPGGGTTSISGVVYAPNGIDPLPNVLVYIPNDTVAAFTPGVACPVIGAPPSGSPLVGATTAVDGSFTIPDAPVGTNIPLVIVSGRWRRQLVIPSVGSCANTALPQGFASFPQNQTQGDIPKIAIATGAVDSVECVLRKVGISDSEFTDPSGTGRINFYTGDYGPGSSIDTATPAESSLMSSTSTLNSYDVLMLPCEGGAYTRPNTELANLISFANAGGRVYGSHYMYAWMDQNPPFSTVVNWLGQSGTTYADNTLATVNAAFSGGATLKQWLTDVGASTVPGEIPLQQIKHDFNGVNSPTESWLTLNVTGNPTMQFVFDTPVGATTNQCGRVLYNEYHVETPVSNGKNTFPNECTTSTTMTPQEKLLEYSLFELTNDGGSATLAPTTANFGSESVGFASATQTFTWTNNSSFAAGVTLLTGSGDFNVVGSNCASVAGYGSCQIVVDFTPTMLGAETGILTVGSNGQTLTAALTGTGTPALTITTASLGFGTLDVGQSITQSIALMNSASGPVTVPGFATTGDFTASSNCGTSLAAGATCAVAVTFTPSTSGPRTGTLSVQGSSAGTPTALSGNGVDFTIASSPTSGSTIAGDPISTAVTITPLAGFSNEVKASCTTNANASTCTLGNYAFTPTTATKVAVTITTTSQYTVIGYTAGLGGPGWLTFVGLGTGLLLWFRRRTAFRSLRSALTLAALAALLAGGSLGLSGCSSKLPAQNASFTAPGAYTYTITVTDGFLVHSATYALTVTAK